MTRDDVPADAQPAVAEQLHNLVSPTDVRRVLHALQEVTRDYVRDGRPVRVPGLGLFRPVPLKQRHFRSNLPQLKGRVCVSRLRFKLDFEPEGRLRQIVRRGAVALRGADRP